MKFEIDMRSPQLDEVIARLAELRQVQDNIDLLSATISSDVELVVKTLLALDKKVDALALTAAAPGSVAQPAAPVQEQPGIRVVKKAAPAKRRKSGAPEIELLNVEHVAGNGKDAAEDEDALRARAEFESKRVRRIFGIGASRAVIKKVAGDGVLQIDDVPAWQLLQLLSELQAL